MAHVAQKLSYFRLCIFLCSVTTDTASLDAASAGLYRTFYDLCLDLMLKKWEASLLVDLPHETLVAGRTEWEQGNAAYLAKVHHRY